MSSKVYYFSYFFFFSFCQLQGQTIPVGSTLAENFLRRNQITGQIKSNTSFTIRPIITTDSMIASDSNSKAQFDILKQWYGNDTKFQLFNKKIQISLLPIFINQQYNSHHPYGWNDGAMIPARGYQSMVSAGIFVKTGMLTIQLKPEFVYAQNKDFETFPTNHFDIVWANYYYFLNRIDAPEKFGNNSFQKISPGQSSIRLNYKAHSIGLSTENLWWGPGIRNSLVMSNNAEGFAHVTLNSTRPIKTRIGTIEYQIIGGRLNSSGFLPPEINRVYNGNYLYAQKPNDWRYLNGMAITWQPKWTPGLFLGLTRAFYLYKSNVGNSVLDYLPVFSSLFKSNNDDSKESDQLASVFLRWVMPVEKAELYFEFGRNDHSLNIRDFLMSPEHTRAYIFGGKKMFALPKKALFEVAAELTQLESTKTILFRQQEGWYRHYQVRDGYTNYGQVMGAGIGPGSNSQMISFKFIKGLKNVGIMFERVVRDNDFFYQAFTESKDFRRYWVDLSTTATAEWVYNKFLLSANMSLIRSLNYQWWYFDYLPLTSPTNYFQNGYDVLNFHAHLSFSYRL